MSFIIKIKRARVLNCFSTTHGWARQSLATKYKTRKGAEKRAADLMPRIRATEELEIVEVA